MNVLCSLKKNIFLKKFNLFYLKKKEWIQLNIIDLATKNEEVKTEEEVYVRP